MASPGPGRESGREEPDRESPIVSAAVDTAPRVERLLAEARARETAPDPDDRAPAPDVLLVYHPVNVRYLSGFTGSHALALIDVTDRLGGHRFLTDFRYKTQSAEQVSADTFALTVIDDGKLLEDVVSTLSHLGGSGLLGFDDAHTTVAQHTHLRKLLSEAECDWTLLACGGLVERLRLVKDPEEIARIRAAAQLADRALLQVLDRGLAGRTEREVALDLETTMRVLGASGPSFPSIVAAGVNGAKPHAEPGEGQIAPGELVTIDWGALLDGYCSDCTRTYATGESISPLAREVYELVRRAQAAGVASIHAGPTGVELDAGVRDLIEAAGHSDHFGHGLGHGVGLEVHEGPRLSRTAPDEPILAGSVVTVEPGVYVPGECGVRIEDLLVVRDSGSGHEVLTGLPTELTVIS
jgi:Xaa-Pro aminopeptidase